MHLQSLSNAELHAELQSICGGVRNHMVTMLRYLAQVDERSLYALMGYRSLFSYCLKALQMSENEAGPRIAVARLAKIYPWVLEALATGDIHLTGLAKLSGYMLPTNCLDLLFEARGRTVSEIEDLLAVRFPKPDVPESIRPIQLREREPQPRESGKTAADGELALAESGGTSDVQSTASTLEESPFRHNANRKQTGESREVLKALSATRHKMQITIGTDLKQKLERARDLMSHRNRSGSYEFVVGVAVDLLLEKLERERLAMLKRASLPTEAENEVAAKEEETKEAEPKQLEEVPVVTEPAVASEATQDMANQATSNETTVDQPPSSLLALAMRGGEFSTKPIVTEPLAEMEGRPVEPSASNLSADRRRVTVSRAVRREVFERDGEQCSFVSDAGVRCDARSYLEIDHVSPKALGGEGSVANTRVLCATHNRLAAEQVFGRDFIRRRIREARERRRQAQERKQLMVDCEAPTAQATSARPSG